MTKLLTSLEGYRTILGAIIQIVGAVGLIAAGLLDYLNGIGGGGAIKETVGLAFAGNAISQLGIRFSKKPIVRPESQGNLRL